PDPNVLSALLGDLDLIHNAFESDATHPLLSAYVRKTFGPALDRVGFEPKAGEPQTVTIVRPQLIRTLALYGDDERVWSFVRERSYRGRARARLHNAPALRQPELRRHRPRAHEGHRAGERMRGAARAGDGWGSAGAAMRSTQFIPRADAGSPVIPRRSCR